MRASFESFLFLLLDRLLRMRLLYTVPLEISFHVKPPGFKKLCLCDTLSTGSFCFPALLSFTFVLASLGLLLLSKVCLQTSALGSDFSSQEIRRDRRRIWEIKVEEWEWFSNGLTAYGKDEGKFKNLAPSLWAWGLGMEVGKGTLHSSEKIVTEDKTLELLNLWGLMVFTSQADSLKVSDLLGQSSLLVSSYHYLICTHLQWVWDKVGLALNPFYGIKYNKKECSQEDRFMKSS